MIPRAGMGRGERERLAGLVVDGYRRGESLSALAAQTGRSYGYVRRLLLEAGVTLRPRGGRRRR